MWASVGEEGHVAVGPLVVALAAVSSEGYPVLVCLGPLTRAEENNYARHAEKQGSQALVLADAFPQGNPLCRNAASRHGCPGSTKIAC
mgnify:CR=1 FL=1